MSMRVVTVFGGTGFLGRRVVRHLRNYGFSVRIASRHPDRGRRLFGSGDPELRAVGTDIHDERTVVGALADAYGAVNAVSLYVEHGRETFHSVHVEAAERVAILARRAGVERLVHVSGIGADAASPSLYIRKRGEGELAVQAAFKDAILVRPAVMFGPDDAFLTTILELLRRLPIYPLFGRGLTRLQPAYVEDVAGGIVSALRGAQARAITFECGGPRIYSYEELLRVVAREAGLERTLVPIPFAAWHALAWIAEVLPTPPITRNQVELMEVDTVCSAGMPGFEELAISPSAVEDILKQML
jgi:NADH dehydrogenase